MFSPSTPAWYAATVKPKHEHAASVCLRGKGLEVFNPIYRERRRWSDRVKEIEVPLFPGYVFCRFGVHQRMAVLKTPSVTSIVSTGNEPAALSNKEIAAVQAIVASGRHAIPWRYPAIGHTVRVTGGCLAGLLGTVVREKNAYRVVVNIELLQRSVAVEIDNQDLVAARGVNSQESPSICGEDIQA